MSRQFFIVGAQRCGTSYLHTVLDEHPEIEMAKPLAPEPKFFLRGDFASLKRSDYESRYFGHKPGATRWGEKSTSYMEYETAARRIAGWYGDAQLIFMLRHPAERAFSNYHFSRRNGLEDLPMSVAFAEEDRRRDSYDRGKLSASPFAYLKRGHYMNDIRAYERHFGRSQLILLIQEELVGDAGRIQDLYGTLGVKREFVPPSLRAVINSESAVGEHPSPEVRDRLAGIFAESIAELEDYMGREITAWRGQPVARVAG